MTGVTLDRRRRRRVRVGLWILGCVGAVLVTFGLVVPRFGPWGHLTLPAALVLLHPLMHRRGAVPILMYHAVNPRPGWPPWERTRIPPAALERYLWILRHTGRPIVSTRALLAARNGGPPLPRRAVVLHFDDGYLDNWVGAAPLLRRFDAPATFFVSLDFLEGEGEPRPTLADVEHGQRIDDLSWRGYLNRAEVRALDADPLFDVESHGTDHGRVPVAGEPEGILTQDNWRAHAWMQWRAMPQRDVEESGAAWAHWEAPKHVELGTPIPASAPALAAASEREGDSAYATRVQVVLKRSRAELGALLGREVDLFCWPEDATNARARDWAREAGFTATTAGGGENRPFEDTQVLSRVYCGDRFLGFPCVTADNIGFRALVGLAAGNYYWYMVTAPMNLVRGLVERRRT